MSDFDEEAERERLREKYEQDRKEREATERMSELLLQGATMTNAHCSACGDPIFRYDGQEFCPTCERPVDRGDSADTQPDEDDDTGDGESDSDSVEVTTPSDDSRVVFGGDGTDDRLDADTRQDRPETDGREGDRDEQRRGDRGRQRRATDPETRGESQPHASVSRPDRPAATDPTDGTEGGSDIEAARASLVRTLAAFSQRAEATDDPRRAREHLQAAREAAEALAALRQ